MLKSSLKGILWSAAGTVGQQLAAFGILMILTRQLGPIAFGIAAMAFAVVDLVAILSRAGITEIAVRERAPDQKWLSTAFWIGIAAGGVTAAALIAVAPWLAYWLGFPEITGYLILLAGSLALSGILPVFEAMMLRQMRFKAIATRNIGATLSSGAIAIAFALHDAGAMALIVQRLVYTLWMVIVTVPAAHWAPTMQFDVRAAVVILRQGFACTLSSFLGMGNQRVLDLIVGAAFGPAVLGYMRIAWRMIEIMLEFTVSSINRVMLPSLAQVQGDDVLFRDTYSRFVAICAATTYPLFVGSALIAPDLLPLLFGTKWGPAAALMQLLAGGVLLVPLIYFKSTVLLIKQRMRLILALNVFEFALSLAIALLAAMISIEAVAAGNALRMALATPVILLALASVGLPARPMLISLIGPLVATCAMVVAVLLCDSAIDVTWIRVVTSIIVGATVYGAVLIALYWPRRRELLPV